MPGCLIWCLAVQKEKVTQFLLYNPCGYGQEQVRIAISAVVTYLHYIISQLELVLQMSMGSMG